jgi:hypothetical protein
MPVKLKTGGTWKTVSSIKLKTGGTWKTVSQAYLKVSGAWKRIFGAGTAPESNLLLTKSINSTNKLAELTATNYHWDPVPTDLVYKFQWFNGSTWSDLTSYTTITNPSSGSSNHPSNPSHNPLVIQNSELMIAPNVQNKYIFTVRATYGGSYYVESSNEVTIETPRDISDLSASVNSSDPADAIDLSWSASLYANNYKIYYKTSGDYSYAGITSSTSYTVSGLNPSTSYTFKILPITGNSSYAGYTGNYSNTASATTGGAPSVIDGPYAFVTTTTVTVTFAATNTQSWSISRGGTTLASGNGYYGSAYETGLTPGTQYFYVITLWSGLNQTGTIGYDFIYPTTDTLPAPVNISAPELTGSGSNLTVTSGSWSNSPTSYTYVWYRDDISPTSAGNPLKTTSNTTSTIDTYSGTTQYSYGWYVAVTAKNAGGTSSVAYSNTYEIPSPYPTTPTSLAASTDRTDGINLTFSGSSNADSYDIFWNIVASSAPSSGATPDFPGVSSPYLWTSAPTDTNRWFWVRGKNSYGTSSWYPSGDGVLGKRISAPTPPDFTPAPPDFTPAPPDFTPAPPDFTPAPPSFPYFKGGKGPGCIYSDTRLLTVNNGYMAAKNISVGDKLISVMPVVSTEGTVLNTSIDVDLKLVSVDVISVEKSVKDVIGFNSSNAFYSAAQPIIVDRDGIFTYVRVGDILVGDTIINIDPNTMEVASTLVNSIKVADSVEVYDIRTAPYQWYIVEDNIAIS